VGEKLASFVEVFRVPIFSSRKKRKRMKRIEQIMILANQFLQSALSAQSAYKKE
jgi:hypothetical protein